MEQMSKDNLSKEDKWRIVMARDGSYDGVFVFAVRSTGIYCKPSCPARRPDLEQVVFFSNATDAEQSGFRPCKRCQPRETESFPQIDFVKRVCRYIEANIEDKLTLSTLSAHVGISPYHLQRTFKRVMGISPRRYIEAQRLTRFKLMLRKGESVTKALYDAGFTSRSRLYEGVPEKLGMTPGTYRRGGKGMHINYTIADCPLGRLLVAATEKGVCAVYLGDSDSVEDELYKEYPAAEISLDDINLRKWVTPFLDYFNGQPLDLSMPLDVQATVFRWKVWKEIRSIPYGSTSTYGEIARALGTPRAARAVANACAANPVSLVIPCHRVVRENGELGGYRWGIKRKQDLLSHEKKTATIKPLTK